MTHYVSQSRAETPIRRGAQFCCSFVEHLLEHLFAKNYENRMRFDKIIAKINGCNVSASHCILKNFLLHSLSYLPVSWTSWDWPLTWLTNHCPSVVWHCWWVQGWQISPNISLNRGINRVSLVCQKQVSVSFCQCNVFTSSRTSCIKPE